MLDVVHAAHMQTIEAMLLLPDSRDQAVAITHLETGRMLMNKAVMMLTEDEAKAALDAALPKGPVILT